jgi:hypothetical protein
MEEAGGGWALELELGSTAGAEVPWSLGWAAQPGMGAVHRARGSAAGVGLQAVVEAWCGMAQRVDWIVRWSQGRDAVGIGLVIIYIGFARPT